MRLVKTVDAVGKTICHDITEIVKDVTKGVKFKKGHIVREEDIEVLHKLGKFNLYIWEDEDNVYIHENEAAELLISMCINENMTKSEVKEGKIDLYSKITGLFKVNAHELFKVNSFNEVVISARHNYYPVKSGDKLLGTRIIPLMIEKSKLDEVVCANGGRQIFDILPYQIKKVGVITTGSEVYKGLIKDTFTPVIVSKLKEFEVEVAYHEIVGDDINLIKEKILEFKNLGVEMIICTGGMSVDPDDMTPRAIKESGAELVTYGTPVLPGAMFLLAYFEDKTPIIGLPGCVMYSKKTIFDIMLPRLLAKEEITKYQIARLGDGGLCLDCDICHYPNCQFGKGI